MKYFFALTIFFLIAPSFAQTNRQILEDIQDQLDFMEFERAMGDIQKKREQSDSNRSPKLSESPLQMRVRVSEFSRIFKNENVSIYIRDSSIENMGTKENPIVSYLFIYEFYKPQYINDKTFFLIEGSATMYCKQRRVIYSSALTHALDKKLNVVNKINPGTGSTDGLLSDHERRYLCS